MHSRPIVNTRDEPHADPEKYRRLHVIVGDANMAEVSTYLKMGTMAIVLSMVEDDFIDRDLSIDGPVGAFREVSRDLGLPRDHPAQGRPHASAPSTTSASSWPSPSATTATASTSRGCAR